MRLLFILLICPLLAFGQSISSKEQNVPVYLPVGWSMFGYSCMDSKDVAEAFSGFEDLIVIVKDGDGNPYLPEYGYNGLGPLQMHRGYQIKLTEAITDFQFCPFLVPLVEGCMDTLACNYNTMQGPCEFAENGYDCDGNSITCYPIEDEAFLDYLKNDYDFYDLPVIIDDCLDVNAASNYTIIDIYNSSYPIKDLDGLQYFTNIERVDISYMDSLISIPQLSTLTNLTYLDIDSNNILSIIPDLSSLENLTYLSISRNPNLSYIPDHSKLIGLDTLVFFSNGVNYDSQYLSNFTSLKALAVDDYSSQSQYFDSELFKNLEFYCICNASGTELTEELPKFKNLQSLYVFFNDSLKSLPDLSGLTGLEDLYISYNNSLKTIPDLSGLTALEHLYIEGNNSLITLPDFSGLSNLRDLIIYDNNSLKIIPDLSGLTALESLHIGRNNSSCVGGYPDQLDIYFDYPPVCPTACPYDIFVEYSDSAYAYDESACVTLVVSGCTDTKAENYNSEANTNDDSCEYIYGCMDTNADNYNPEATKEDSSCIFYGCINPQADNFDSQANQDDGSCLTYGCINPTAENYNAEANQDDGSCIVYGCTLSVFPNYNSAATEGDGSCDMSSTDIFGCIDDTYLEYDVSANTDNGSCVNKIVLGCTDSDYMEYNASANTSDASACATLAVVGCMNDQYTEYNANANIDSDPTSCQTVIVQGCVDLNAFNYDSNANTGDGSCIAIVYGCMDSTACNYNPEANMSDGSCEYAEEGYDCEGNEIYQVGDLAHGGIVFYVDETGQHGLVAAQEDLEGTYEWGCLVQTVSGADGQAIGTGHQNTMDIVNQGCTTENGGITAAQAALDAEINGYSDWYLPSRDELIEMYDTIGYGSLEGNIGGFETSDRPYYWSSSENSTSYAWVVNFNNGNTFYYNKYVSTRVRVIRAF